MLNARPEEIQEDRPRHGMVLRDNDRRRAAREDQPQEQGHQDAPEEEINNVANERRQRRERNRNNRQQLALARRARMDPWVPRRGAPRQRGDVLHDDAHINFMADVLWEPDQIDGGPRRDRNLRERHRQLFQRHQRHPRRPIRDPGYYRSAAREANALIACKFCSATVARKKFLSHLESCRKANEDYRERVIAAHKYKSGTYSLHAALYKLRETLEISYFEAKLDPTKLEDMECRTCASFEDHMAGGCMLDHQREVFLMYANDIAGEIMAIYEQSLELTKQKGFDDKFSEYSQFFDPIDVLDEFADLESQHQRRAAYQEYCLQHGDQAAERVKYIEEQASKNKVLYDSRKKDVDQTISLFADSMVHYIQDLKDSAQLANTLRARKSFDGGRNEEEEGTGDRNNRGERGFLNIQWM